jgi:miniconductance mechanosensitive channel
MELAVLTIIETWLNSLGLEEKYTSQAVSALAFGWVLLGAWIVYQLLNRIIFRYLKKLADKTITTWDDILFEKKVFRRLSHLVPAIIIYNGTAVALAPFSRAVILLQSGTYLYMIIIGILVIDAVINSLHQIYNSMSVSKNRSIKGYVQVVKIFIYIFGAGFVLSVLLQKDLTTFFAGLGAMAAVLMLIFKDSILGLVAGVQLSANDMVRLGDWIQMDSRTADGTVIDISLNTVKVQNWDRTISTIPTYALVSESFTNWRGMEESGGRRIKRSVYIDMNSIHFLSREEIVQFKKIQIIRNYIEQRELEVEQYNREHGVDDSMPVNGRRLTNIGTFRRYMEEYLKRHPKIHQDMTFLVRHLQPTDKGLPVEIYVFCNDQRWTFYEAVQADIFDHLLAIIPQFGLRIYQNPSGNDVARLAENYRSAGTENLVGLQ